MMFDSWKLSEYRNKRNPKNSIEQNWLNDIEIEYQERIRNYILEIEAVIKSKEFRKFRQLVNSFLSGEIKISNDEIILYLNERMQKINSSILSRKMEGRRRSNR